MILMVDGKKLVTSTLMLFKSPKTSLMSNYLNILVFPTLMSLSAMSYSLENKDAKYLFCILPRSSKHNFLFYPWSYLLHVCCIFLTFFYFKNNEIIFNLTHQWYFLTPFLPVACLRSFLLALYSLKSKHMLPFSFWPNWRLLWSSKDPWPFHPFISSLLEHAGRRTCNTERPAKEQVLRPTISVPNMMSN